MTGLNAVGGRLVDRLAFIPRSSGQRLQGLVLREILFQRLQGFLDEDVPVTCRTQRVGHRPDAVAYRRADRFRDQRPVNLQTGSHAPSRDAHLVYPLYVTGVSERQRFIGLQAVHALSEDGDESSFRTGLFRQSQWTGLGDSGRWRVFTQTVASFRLRCIEQSHRQAFSQCPSGF